MSTVLDHEVTLNRSQKESYQYLRDNIPNLLERHCENIKQVTSKDSKNNNGKRWYKRVIESNSYIPETILNTLPTSIIEALLLFDDESEWDDKAMFCTFVFKPCGLEIYRLNGRFEFEAIDSRKTLFRLHLEINTNVDNIKSQLYLIPDIILDPTLNTISSLINQQVIDMARNNFVDITKDIQDV